MFPPIQDLYRIAPEIVLCGFGMLVMLLSPLVPKARQSVLAGVALVGAALALVATIFHKHGECRLDYMAVNHRVAGSNPAGLSLRARSSAVEQEVRQNLVAVTFSRTARTKPYARPVGTGKCRPSKRQQEREPSHRAPERRS